MNTVDAQNLPPELAKVVAAWPKLLAHIRAAIETLAET